MNSARGVLRDPHYFVESAGRTPTISSSVQLVSWVSRLVRVQLIVSTCKYGKLSRKNKEKIRSDCLVEHQRGGGEERSSRTDRMHKYSGTPWEHINVATRCTSAEAMAKAAGSRREAEEETERSEK